MRNIWTVARKELRGYFDHPTAYILLVVFLVINNFFFFRSVFLFGEASLRSMFDMLPWVLLFFVPAVTMGALAEEKRHGTLEVALSHPIHPYEFMLGKYVGDLLFLTIALAATLPVPLLMLLGGSPDPGVVVAQYVGAFLLIAGMAAVGIFASALTRNQITAFIVATTVIFVLMMVGTEVVQIGMPAWLAEPLGRLGILSHFGNVARGVIDLRDAVYFVSLGAAFLALAYWLLLRDRLSRGSRLYRNLQVGTVVIVAIAVVANLFGGYIPGRLDLTAENLYTLSDGTRHILRGLDDVVTITLYTSEELPAQVRPLARDINDVLRDFDRYGGGDVQVVRKHPDESEEATQEAQQLGIRPVQFNVVRREELQLKQGWMGIAIRYAGESEVIPFVGDTGNLEYELAANIWRLTRESAPKVAFISGQGEKTPADYRSFNQALREAYEVSTVDLAPSDSAADVSIDPDLDAVIVAGPKQPLQPRARRMLRGYLEGDGRILYLGAGADINLRFLFASEVLDSALDFTQTLGVRVNGDLVYDLQSNEAISVPGEVFNYVVPYPFWVRALPLHEDHPITRGINSVFLPWPSSLDTLSTVGGRRFTPLLATTRYAGRQRGNFQIRPDQQMAFDESNLSQLLLAVALEGAVGIGPGSPTASGNGAIDLGAGGDQDTAAAAGDTVAAPPPARPGQTEGATAEAETDSAQRDTTTAAPEGPRIIERQATEGPPIGRAVVVGDADFLDDNFVRNAPENLVFALNAVDWLTQTEALLGIRSKTPTPRPLIFESDLERQAVKYINLIGVPLAFVLLGAFRMLRRRRRTRKTYGA